MKALKVVHCLVVEDVPLLLACCCTYYYKRKKKDTQPHSLCEKLDTHLHSGATKQQQRSRRVEGENKQKKGY